MKKSVSVIIPNYNGKHLLEMYLPSVITALNAADTTYELIVVDDCSKDDSVFFIKNSYPQVILLVNEKNSGFSYTCNQGIGIAQMELTLLLNSDVQLTPAYFADQWAYFEMKDTFGVMGRIMSKDGQRIEDAARLLVFKGCRIKANHFYYIDEPHAQVYTTYLSGANALVDTRKLKELAGFDEIFSPFTYEDYDLCIRAWLLGWKCYYEHNSVCYHQVSGSIRTQLKSNFIKTVYFRNRFIFHHIHLTGLRASLWPMYLLIFELLPKLLLGKTWIFKSYTDYKKASTAIKSSQTKLHLLKQVHQSKFNISSIIHIIKASLQEKGVTRI